MQIAFETPFYAALNINIKNGYSMKGGYTTKAAKVAIDDIAWSCQKAVTEAGLQGKWEPRKFYVDIVVHKPRLYAGDPTNFQKPIVDAVAPVLGVNDRLCAASTDWRDIGDGEKARFEITVRQEDGEDG